MPARFWRNQSLLWLPRAGLRRGCLRVGLTSLLVLIGGRAVHDATASNETRTLSFHHTHSSEDLTVTFKRNGRYDEDALKKLNHYLRDWRSQDEIVMDRQLFDIIWEVYREVDAKEPIQIVSAYRAPATNAMLRRRSSGVARHSQHMLGHAMDLFIPGVPLEQIRFAGLRLQRGGVGFYPESGSPFVHLDTGSIRHWPRMSHDQLARVFPDGRTVHVPSDGKPLKGYELAMADIQRRGSGGSDGAVAPTKSFLASLFSRKSSDEEDEGAAISAPAKATPTTVADASAGAAKPAASVPLPRTRPATYQVASAIKDEVVAAKNASQKAVQTVVDVINSRFWGNESASKPTEALKVASLKARFASTFAESTASVSATEIKPWSADDKSEAKPQTLAYAASNALPVVTASAPMPRLVRPPPTPSKVDQVIAKGPQPVPTNLAQVSAKTTLDPWTRAMMMAPNFHYAMLATAMGDQDMTLLRAQFVKPEAAIAIAFTDEPTPGLSCERFTGSATAKLTTTSFRL